MRAKLKGCALRYFTFFSEYFLFGTFYFTLILDRADLISPILPCRANLNSRASNSRGDRVSLTPGPGAPNRQSLSRNHDRSSITSGRSNNIQVKALYTCPTPT